MDRRRAAASGAVAGRSCGGRSSRAVPPQPPDVAAERLGEQGEGDGERDPAERERQNVGRGDRERDALRRGDGLAPVAPRQLARASTGAAHPAARNA